MELDFIRNYFVENKLNVSSLHNKPFQIINNNKNKKLTGNQDFLHSLYKLNGQILIIFIKNLRPKYLYRAQLKETYQQLNPIVFIKDERVRYKKNYLRFRFT